VSDMKAAELLEDEMADTVVDSPSGVRRKSSTGQALEALAETVIGQLSRPDGAPIDGFAARLIPTLERCRASFASWPKSPPTADVRADMLTEFTSLHRMALDHLYPSSRAGAYSFVRGDR
jgi:hypothetical protein